MMLLDTDVMVDLLRQHPPAVAWVETRAEEEIVLPGYVVMELIQARTGRTRKRSERH